MTVSRKPMLVEFIEALTRYFVRNGKAIDQAKEVFGRSSAEFQKFGQEVADLESLYCVTAHQMEMIDRLGIDALPGKTFDMNTCSSADCISALKQVRKYLVRIASPKRSVGN